MTLPSGSNPLIAFPPGEEPSLLACVVADRVSELRKR